MVGAETPDARRDFFISYTASDQAWAEWIAWQLEKAGYSVLLQAWDLVPGTHWLVLMNEATRHAERTLAVVSAEYLRASPLGQAEWLAAYRRDPLGSARRLIPLRVEDCRLDGLLAGVIHADLFDLAVDEARQALLATVRAAVSRRAKPVAEPSFPGGFPISAMPDALGSPPFPVTEDRAGSPDRRTESAYLAQVRQIAPVELLDREQELSDLSTFCTQDQDGSYVWWRAAAWTGKSALLSTFVLHPPRGVRVVAFFVTARFAGNSNRAAFVEIVTAQLAELLGELVPQHITEATQEFYFLHLLAQAARRCQERRQRLVLVVDGLDEDGGVTLGPGARSIAALLPTNPPAGLRVIVAGRPGPPIPSDVPHGHPLRREGITRSLTSSPHAAVSRASMQWELDRLRRGTPLERDLLGLLAAAGGGLSSRDLAELATEAGLEATDWDVERLLSTVAGRSFAGRPARWRRGTDAIGYVLGHEELQDDALRSYGPRRLAAFRERLHTWAEAFRRQRWPADTPEYLLRGYFRLLLATGDLTRLVDCASDLARHDRMLELSGGDTAGLAEIAETQQAVFSATRVDLARMARLAYHHRRLALRNINIPIALPAVWCRLGQPNRAEQLANALPTAAARAQALALLADALVALGRDAEARAVAVEAESAAAPADSDAHRRALLALVTVRARAGEHEEARMSAFRAEALAHATPNPYLRARALAEVATAMASAGLEEHAAQLAETIDPMDMRSEALIAIACARGRVAEPERARSLMVEAERSLALITAEEPRARARSQLVQLLAVSGELEKARALVETAERAARARTRSGDRLTALTTVVEGLAMVGDVARARIVAREIEDAVEALDQRGAGPHDFVELSASLARAGELEDAERVARRIERAASRANALTIVAESSLAAHKPDQARRLAVEAEQTARSISAPESELRARAMLSGALAGGGEYERAERIARTIAQADSQDRVLIELCDDVTHGGDHREAERIAHGLRRPQWRAQALITVASALVSLGSPDEARRVISHAERVARSIPDVGARAQLLLTLIDSLAGVGAHAQALNVAFALESLLGGPDSPAPPEFLAALANTLANVGQHSRAEEAARAIAQPAPRAQALAAVVTALAKAGRVAEAEQIAGTIVYPYAAARARAAVADAAASAGQSSHAEKAALAIADAAIRDRSLAKLVATMAHRGEFADAERLARVITVPADRAQALTSLADALARTGKQARAVSLAHDAARTAAVIHHQPAQARALAAVARALLHAGDYAQARRLAGTVRRDADRARTLISLMAALAEDDRADKIQAMVGEISQLVRGLPQAHDRTELLLLLAETLTTAGEHQRARIVARQAASFASEIAYPPARALLSRHTVTALARTGDHEGAVAIAGRAEQFAQAIADPQERAQALAMLGVALSDATANERARRLVAMSLTVGDWAIVPLESLSGFAADALIGLADAMLEASE